MSRDLFERPCTIGKHPGHPSMQLGRDISSISRASIAAVYRGAS